MLKNNSIILRYISSTFNNWIFFMNYFVCVSFLLTIIFNLYGMEENNNSSIVNSLPEQTLLTICNKNLPIASVHIADTCYNSNNQLISQSSRYLFKTPETITYKPGLQQAVTLEIAKAIPSHIDLIITPHGKIRSNDTITAAINPDKTISIINTTTNTVLTTLAKKIMIGECNNIQPAYPKYPTLMIYNKNLPRVIIKYIFAYTDYTKNILKKIEVLSHSQHTIFPTFVPSLESVEKIDKIAIRLDIPYDGQTLFFVINNGHIASDDILTVEKSQQDKIVYLTNQDGIILATTYCPYDPRNTIIVE